MIDSKYLYSVDCVVVDATMSEIEFEDAAEGIVELWNRLGIDYVFSSPGSEYIPLWEHMARYNSKGKKPIYMNLRHEGAALSMAKGYYMATGKAQVILTHVLTGLLHGAMELKAAYTDNIPLVMVVGQNKTHDNEVYGGSPGPHYLSFTEIGGQQRLVQPYVKWSETPETNANILEIIQRAYQIANSDVKGPVLLNISRELLFEKKCTIKIRQEETAQLKKMLDMKTLQKISKLLYEVRNPLILKRYLDKNKDAVASLIEFSEFHSRAGEKKCTMKMPQEENAPPSITADPNTLQKISKLLIEARNPIIYTRYLGRNKDAVASLTELSDLLGVPVFETPGYMNFPTNHPLHMGMDISPYIEDSDLIFVIDSSAWPPWYPPSKIKKLSKAKIVFMDIDPLQLKYPVYGYPVDLLIKADSSIAIPQITELLKTGIKDDSLILDRIKRWSSEHTRIRREQKELAMAAQYDVPIDPRWLCHCINEVISQDTKIVHETITHGRLIHQYIEKNRTTPGTRYESTGPVAHTGLGQGMGIALGVKLAEPDKTVIALEGDGSFNYNPVQACFGASQEYEIPFMTIIFNNACYAAMKGHARYYPNGHSVKENIYYGVGCGPAPKYTMLAEAYDGYGETVEDPSEVKAALLRGIKEVNDGRLVLLDVKLKQ